MATVPRRVYRVVECGGEVSLQTAVFVRRNWSWHYFATGDETWSERGFHWYDTVDEAIQGHLKEIYFRAQWLGLNQSVDFDGIPIITKASIAEDRQRFLDLVRAVYGDRTSAQVFADWLDERGEHRAATMLREAFPYSPPAG